MLSQLEQLQARCTLAVEAADLGTIRSAGASDVHLTISRITAAAQLPEHAELVDEALRYAQRQAGKAGKRKLVAILAVERLGVEFARRAVDTVAGRVSLEVDSRLAYDTTASVERGRELVRQLVEAGVERERIVVRLPATWEGIQAAAKLERSDVRCHLALVFGMAQLVAAAEAGATLVSPAVGRISDFHAKRLGVAELPPAQDPAVELVGRMRRYLETKQARSELVPGMFRTAAQAVALSACPGLALPPALLAELRAEAGELAAPADVPAAPVEPADQAPLDAAAFAAALAADPVGSSKLSQGVKNSAWAMVSQEKQLAEWITSRQDEAAKRSAIALFEVWDYDGDGFIEREEWGGTEEVFNALDRNHDGRITLEEMVLGLGAPTRPAG